MISVIVVTYNQEDTIGRTLDSILAQDFAGDMEIIVGDDSSTDGTGRVCEEYARRHPDKIRYFRRPQNLGVNANYFDCIENARGEYLADCAGDDFWVDPTKLRRQAEYLDAHPDVSMVTTDWLCCDIDGTNVRRAPERPEVTEPIVFEKGTLGIEVLCNSVNPHLCTALYRREPIMRELRENRAVMVNPDYTCEDTQIELAMDNAGKTVILPGVTLHYSVGHESISHNDDLAGKFDYFFRSMQQDRTFADHFGITGKRWQRRLSGFIDFLSAVAFHSGSAERAEKISLFRKETGLKGGLKSRLYHLAMSSRQLWRLFRGLHSA